MSTNDLDDDTTDTTAPVEIIERTYKPSYSNDERRKNLKPRDERIAFLEKKAATHGLTVDEKAALAYHRLMKNNQLRAKKLYNKNRAQLLQEKRDYHHEKMKDVEWAERHRAMQRRAHERRSRDREWAEKKRAYISVRVTKRMEDLLQKMRAVAPPIDQHTIYNFLTKRFRPDDISIVEFMQLQDCGILDDEGKVTKEGNWIKKVWTCGHAAQKEALLLLRVYVKPWLYDERELNILGVDED